MSIIRYLEQAREVRLEAMHVGNEAYGCLPMMAAFVIVGVAVYASLALT